MFVGIFGVALLEKKYHTTRLETAQIIMAFFIALAISAPIIGSFSTKQKRRKPYIQVGAFILLILTAALIFMKGYGFVYYVIAYLSLGVAAGCIVLGLTMIHERNIPKITETTIGIIVASTGFFSALEFHLVEALEHPTMMTPSFVVMPICILLACILRTFAFQDLC